MRSTRDLARCPGLFSILPLVMSFKPEFAFARRRGHICGFGSLHVILLLPFLRSVFENSNLFQDPSPVEKFLQ
jgi:hypothetical protein